MNRTVRRVLVFMKDYDAKRGGRESLVSPPSIESVKERAGCERTLVAVYSHGEQS